MISFSLSRGSKDMGVSQLFIAAVWLEISERKIFIIRIALNFMGVRKATVQKAPGFWNDLSPDD